MDYKKFNIAQWFLAALACVATISSLLFWIFNPQYRFGDFLVVLIAIVVLIFVVYILFEENTMFDANAIESCADSIQKFISMNSIFRKFADKTYSIMLVSFILSFIYMISSIVPVSLSIIYLEKISYMLLLPASVITGILIFSNKAYTTLCVFLLFLLSAQFITFTVNLFHAQVSGTVIVRMIITTFLLWNSYEAVK